MQEMGSTGKKHDMEINCIPVIWKSIWLSCWVGIYLVFLHSSQFMASSLEWLPANLPEDALKYTSKAFQNEKLALMKKKGVYPCDDKGSFEKFDNKQLPPKDAFHSILRGPVAKKRPMIFS